MTDEDRGQTNPEEFMQKHKKAMCYKCGKKGRYANKCPVGAAMMMSSQLDQIQVYVHHTVGIKY
jgi:hypothetical protein